MTKPADRTPSQPSPAATPAELLQRAAAEAAQPTTAEQAEVLAKGLLAAGQPNAAFEVARNARGTWPSSERLHYLQALALARGGSHRLAQRSAEALAARADLSMSVRSDAFALLGRLAKDSATRTSDSAVASDLARVAAGWYERAMAAQESAFPAINAATLRLLAGEVSAARDLANRALALQQRTGSASWDAWGHAIVGEALVILDDPQRACAAYAEAVAKAAGRHGDIAVMRKNVRLLAAVGQTALAAEQALAVLSVGHVVAYAGHVVDHAVAGWPDRRRYPDDPVLHARVAAAAAAAFAQCGAIVAYGSVASGADIVCAEVLLAQGAELHVILPFALDDFYETSVDFGGPAGRQWRARCDEVLARAAEVHHATREGFLGNGEAFEVASRYLQGLAVLHAERLGVPPHAVVIIEPNSAVHPGGTASFVGTWRTLGHPLTCLDLEELRGFACDPEIVCKPLPDAQRSQEGRVLRAMLFADVKNFSKLTDSQSPAFFSAFLGQVAAVLAESGARCEFANTWGDGLFAVFDGPVACAEAGLRLIERVEQFDFCSVGLPADTTLRIGVHAGPVFRAHDPVIGRDNFFGAHVNRAARIEPVATPGCVYASEQFAALLATEVGHDIRCEYAGVEALAKGFDRCALYLVGRA